MKPLVTIQKLTAAVEPMTIARIHSQRSLPNTMDTRLTISTQPLTVNAMLCNHSFLLSKTFYNASFDWSALFIFIRFHDCLNSKPYKRGSYEIWSSFETIGVKCFAYLPCDDNSTLHDNIWSQTEHRRLGSCHKGFKVTIFDFINDYSKFIETVLTTKQKHIVKAALRERSEQFMSLHKQTSPCVHKFPNNTRNMITSFTSKFLNGEKDEQFVEIEPTEAVTETDNAEIFIISPETDKKKNQNDLSFISSENLVFALIGLCLLVPTILFILVISILRIHKTLNNYIFIKNNLSDIQA